MMKCLRTDWNHRRFILLVALAVILLTAGCGGEEPTPETMIVSATFTAEPKVVVVTAAFTPTPVDAPAEAAGAPSREQLRDLAWQALDPNTSSHDLANWEVIDLRQVEGREIAGEFADPPAYGCPYWPSPAPNAPIAATETYWLVQFKSRPATPPADPTPISPTAPPNVPEPFIYQAFFLIDPGSGQVVARRLFCVIY